MLARGCVDRPRGRSASGHREAAHLARVRFHTNRPLSSSISWCPPARNARPLQNQDHLAFTAPFVQTTSAARGTFPSRPRAPSRPPTRPSRPGRSITLHPAHLLRPLRVCFAFFVLIGDRLLPTGMTSSDICPILPTLPIPLHIEASTSTSTPVLALPSSCIHRVFHVSSFRTGRPRMRCHQTSHDNVNEQRGFGTRRPRA